MTDQLQETSQPAVVKIIGKSGSADTYTIRDFLHRRDVPFEWIELTSNQQARKDVGVQSTKDLRLPVCIFPEGTRMECPTIRQITKSSDGSAIRPNPSMT
jgi:thioredoxin reductase (NADPH)